MNIHKRFGFIALGFLILVLGVVPAQADHAVLSISEINGGDSDCADLLAFRYLEDLADQV